ncbi:UNVERIFIED_CONTAM: hypothetical protein GTU68_060278 [Idotea baltica]|nr:hypothetical protein [Idotea baltica]
MSDTPEPIDNDDLALVVAEPETKRRLNRPPLYRVLLLNDDYTTMEFVILVLRTVFHHSEEKAAQIMLHVHQRGSGICGVFTREVAETKVDQVVQLAQESEHPLQCTMEPDTEGDEE